MAGPVSDEIIAPCGKGYQLGDKDRKEKILESYNDVFADIVNGCLYDGEQVVQPEEFTDATPWGYYNESGEIHEQERDIAKYWTRKGVYISMIGIENQTAPDLDMPIRVMSYDSAAYRAQLRRKDAEKRKNAAEQRATNHLFPVVSMVLYLGHKRSWNGPLTLKERLDILPALEPYVSDYRMNLYQIAWMSHEEVNRRFHGDFWVFADYLVQVRENREYHPSRQTLRHKREIVMLLNAMERDNRYETAYNDLMLDPIKSKEDWNMCDVLDKVENRGVERGIQQERQRMAGVLDQVENRGVERGIGLGIEQERKRIVRSLAANGTPMQDIADTLQLTLQDVAAML